MGIVFKSEVDDQMKGPIRDLLASYKIFDCPFDATEMAALVVENYFGGPWRRRKDGESWESYLRDFFTRQGVLKVKSEKKSAQRRAR